MSGREERVALVAFVATGLLAGGNGVAIRFSNRELDPLWGAGLRFALAAALLLALMAALRLALPRGRALAGALLYGLFNFAGAFGLFYWALVELHAGFGQILLALVPLTTLLLAVTQRQERLHGQAIGGTVLALTGIVWLSRAALGASLPLPSVLAALGSALCLGQAAVLVRRFPRVHPITMNAVGMTTGSVLLLSASTIRGETLAPPPLIETWLALGYVVAFGSVAVFLLYLVVLRHWTASRAAYVFVLIPMVTVPLSAWLDNERVGPGLVLGGLLVLAGVYLGALRPAPATSLAEAGG